MNVTSAVTLSCGQVKLSAAQAPWPHGDPICLVSVEVLPSSGDYALTRREAEVAQLIAEGQQDKQIARDLDISIHTARRHVERILFKMGCRNRTEAALKLRGMR